MTKRFHYVYEIKNLVNGKLYIGKHSTNNMHDGYMGSGDLLRAAFEKYGIENFEKRILKMFDTEQDAYLYEKELVTVDIVKDPNYYNVVTGGRYDGDQVYSDSVRAKMSSSAKERVERDMKTGKLKKAIVGMRESVSGSSWYNDGVKSIRVRDGETPPDGFVKGNLHAGWDHIEWTEERKAANREMCLRQVQKDRESGALAERVARLNDFHTGSKWYNNGVVNKVVKRGDTPPDGFVLGKLVKR